MDAYMLATIFFNGTLLMGHHTHQLNVEQPLQVTHMHVYAVYMVRIFYMPYGDL